MKKYIIYLLFLPLCFCQKKSIEESLDYPWLKQNPPTPSAEKFVMDSPGYLIKNAKIMTANGDVFEKANLYMMNGLIKKISTGEIKTETDTTIIDGSGLTITPGIIDVHSHMGVYPSPNVDAHEDGNEMTRPVTSDVWAEHAFWPQDPDLWRSLEGGITTIQVLPGSGNLIGGRSFTAKLIPQLSAREMRFDGAPQGLKMACGENPKRTHKEIMTRMGNVAQYRKVFQEAVEYMREWQEYKKGKDTKVPKRNFVSETLVKVLNGEILIHFHCYRADDISAVLDVASEFGFKIRTIHHGLEAYKIAPRLAKENVSVATWADWWGFKAEAFDGIPYNIALLENAGAKAIVHSDSATEIRFLNLEAAKALSSANKLGLKFTEDQALKWITKNPAWALGIDDKVGSLEEGKMADVVLWDGHPFSIYSKTKMVFINGKIVFDRETKTKPRSDFEIGYNDQSFFDGRDFNPVKTVNQIQWPLLNEENKKEYSNHFVINNVTAFINNQWMKDTSLLIKDGKIAQLNPKELASDILKLDGKGRFLSAGLIETNSSLGLFEISLDSQAQDLSSETLDPTPHYQAKNALNLNNIRLPIHRAQGITTSIAKIEGGIAAGYSVAFDLVSDESAVIKEQSALFGSIETTGKNTNRITTWSQLLTLVNESIDFQKNTKAFLSGNTYTFENKHQHLKAMGPILTGESPWVIKANRADDILKIIHLKKKIQNSGFKPRFYILGGAESYLVANELVQNKIPIMMMPTDQTPTTFNKTKARFDLAAVLDKKGVDLIIVDSNDLGAVRTRQEAGMAVKYGLSPEAAMKAITSTPSKYFDLNRGEIAPQKPANLVLWSSDPLEPFSWAEKVWIQGKDITILNRQKELADKYLKLQTN